EKELHRKVGEEALRRQEETPAKPLSFVFIQKEPDKGICITAHVFNAKYVLTMEQFVSYENKQCNLRKGGSLL
ncbi:Hypothetical predicted protein, partial [Podarcis lilfordi]